MGGGLQSCGPVAAAACWFQRPCSHIPAMLHWKLTCLSVALCVQSLEDPEERIGADIVMKALRAPCRAIAGACCAELGETWE